MDYVELYLIHAFMVEVDDVIGRNGHAFQVDDVEDFGDRIELSLTTLTGPVDDGKVVFQAEDPVPILGEE